MTLKCVPYGFLMLPVVHIVFVLVMITGRQYFDLTYLLSDHRSSQQLCKKPRILSIKRHNKNSYAVKPQKLKFAALPGSGKIET